MASGGGPGTDGEQLKLVADEPLDAMIGEAESVILDAITEHEPIAAYALLSGGNDSMVLTDLARRMGVIDAVVHVNTGIGIRETREFVRRVCADWRVPLIEKHPPPGSTYEEIVLDVMGGFPGPDMHRICYARLKERAIDAVVREAKTGRFDRVVLLAGRRRSESKRRSRNVVEVVERQGAKVWVSPLANWTSGHMREYRERFDLPRNEVSDWLHMSGECLCGAFARDDERDLLEWCANALGGGYREAVEQIEALEARARAAGLRSCRWGAGGPPPVVQTGPMCSGCDTLFGFPPDVE